MFKKLYEGLKEDMKKIRKDGFINTFVKSIKRDYKELLIIVFVFLVLIVKLPYSIYSKGGLIPIEDRIVIENKNESKGSLNLTYVTMRDGRVINLLISLLLPNDEIIKNEDITHEDETLEDKMKIDELYMKESDQNAIISAYELLGKQLEISNPINTVIYIDSEAETNLKKFDQIISADRTIIYSIEQYGELVKTKEFGDKIELKVLRDGKEVDAIIEVKEIEKTKMTGISFITLNDLVATPNINVKEEKNEYGPSGGLMTALGVYNALTEFDITKGRIIGGTGTIDIKGNVGEIGGIKYKLMGAVKDDAEVFISPKENCDEAKKLIKEKDYNIELVCVSTLSEAIFELS